ncbi:MAG: 30S ribosomal protein S4e [Candidatus Micrarchaeia archaeon]
MAKRGGTKHLKRLASPKSIPVTDKKDRKWMIRHAPGPHAKKYSIPLGVLVRDVLKLAQTLREVRKMLSNRMVEIDGKPRTDEKFPVGLMDVVSFPKGEMHFRMLIDNHSRLIPKEISKDEAKHKLVRIVRKYTLPGGKLSVTFHDGKNMISDNHLHVGDSAVVSLPVAKLKTHLKREIGARCLVVEGKHAGSIVKLKEIIERKGGKASEALVQDKAEEFITVAKYLFVIDEGFKSG